MSSTSPLPPKSYSFAHRTNHITVLKSDGNPVKWPSNTECVVVDGQVNYMADPTKSAERHWRKAIGTWLAYQLDHSNGVPAHGLLPPIKLIHLQVLRILGS
jgi:hypothetical protein